MSNSIFFVMFMFNFLLLLLRLKSLLMMLFALEFLMLNMFFMYSYLNSPGEVSSCLVFLAMAAGEASLGLSLLVAMVRNFGKDSSEKSSVSLCEGY